MAVGALLKFPSTSPLRRVDQEPLPSDPVGKNNVDLYLETTKYVLDSSRVLVDMLYEHRRSLRQVGVESVIVELSGIIASRRLEDIKETLEEASAKKKEAHLTIEGLSYLKRAERLVADASLGIGRLSGVKEPKNGLGSDYKPEISGGGIAISTELFVVGLVSIIAVALAVIALTRK